MNIERLKILASGLRKIDREEYNHDDLFKCALHYYGAIFQERSIGGWLSFMRAAQVFGISMNEVNWLFNNERSYTVPDDKVTPEMVADRIDAFLAYSGA